MTRKHPVSRIQRKEQGSSAPPPRAITRGGGMRACHVEATEGGPHAGGERTEVAICGGRAANRAAQHQLVQHLLDPDRGEKERPCCLTGTFGVTGEINSPRQ